MKSFWSSQSVILRAIEFLHDPSALTTYNKKYALDLSSLEPIGDINQMIRSPSIGDGPPCLC
jgi:hypothetical protein